MDVNGGSYSSATQSEEDNMDLRRGPWTVEEDILLMNYIANHGEGRWNSLARCAGLKRTGKSCRLRWLNYLRPDVRRGNITLEEQLLILELHSRWGNRWSKIAQHLPGRTDNEIKNYWRTRVQKHAKQLQCDVNSKQFKDTMKYLWMPRLVERIQAASVSSSTTTTTSTHHNPSFNGGYHHDEQQSHLPMGSNTNNIISEGTSSCAQINQSFITSENSSSTNNRVTTTAAATASASSPSEISTVSDYNNLLVDESRQQQQVYDYNNNNTQNTHFNFSESLISPIGNYFNQGLDFHHGVDHQQNNNNMWLGGEDMNLWNVEDDMWFSQQQQQQQQQQFCNGF